MSENIPYIIAEDGYYYVAYKEKAPVPEIVVSSKGVANGLSEEYNDGWDFGPDSYSPTSTSAIPYTQTAGIQEAHDYAPPNSTIKLNAGIFYINKTIILTKPLIWIGSGIESVYGGEYSDTKIMANTSLTTMMTNISTPDAVVSGGDNSSITTYNIGGTIFQTLLFNGNDLSKNALWFWTNNNIAYTHIDFYEVEAISSTVADIEIDNIDNFNITNVTVSNINISCSSAMANVSNLYVYGIANVGAQQWRWNGGLAVQIYLNNANNQMILENIAMNFGNPTTALISGNAPATLLTASNSGDAWYLKLFNLRVHTGGSDNINLFEAGSSLLFLNYLDIDGLAYNNINGTGSFFTSNYYQPYIANIHVKNVFNMNGPNKYPMLNSPWVEYNLTGTNGDTFASMSFSPSISTPSVPASGSTSQNIYPYSVKVYVNGGALTEIQITIGSTSYTVYSNSTASAVYEGFTLPAGASITLTYTTAPTWSWVPE